MATETASATRANCEYIEKGYCEQFGCYAVGFLNNMRDLLVDPSEAENAAERANKVISEAQADGCTESLIFPPATS